MSDYVVKDSGERINYSTGMRRDIQDGKPRYDLVIPLEMKNHMLKRWAVHMTKGAEKYGIRNWELARTEEEYDRFRASAFRHFVQWLEGDTDEDHASAVFFNIQCCEYVKERMKKPSCPHLPAKFDYVCASCLEVVEAEKEWTEEDMARAWAIKNAWSNEKV